MDSKKFANRFRGSWSGATSKLQLNSRAPGFGCDHASQNRVQGRVPSRVPLGIAFFLELPALNRTPPPPLPSPLLFSHARSLPLRRLLCVPLTRGNGGRSGCGERQGRHRGGDIHRDASARERLQGASRVR